MAPSTRQGSLKQGRLSFASSKRTASSLSVKSNGSKSATPINTPPVFTARRDVLSSPDVISSDSESDDDDYVGRDVKRRASNSVTSIVSDTEFSPVVTAPPAKKRRIATKVKPSPAQARAAEDASRAVREGEDGAVSEVFDLQDKKGRLSKHYAQVREKMGNLPPTHAKGLTKIHHILRVFDLSYEYGPCIGVARLERWERAEVMGLKPPPEVREILLTKEAREKDEFSQTVFYGEV